MIKFIVAIFALSSISNADLVRDEAKKVVYDTATKLMWQDNEAVKIKDYQMKRAYRVKYYCGNLNLGGYNDWRLPTAQELRHLFRQNPSKTFKYIKRTEYMTSTPMMSIEYRGGTMYSHLKLACCPSICCVREKDDH